MKELPTITIEDRIIGEDHPTFIIAEIGINHNGDEDLARRLIDEAVASGVDAVKFQKRHLPSLYHPEVLETPERFEQNFQYMIPILKQVELDESAISRLKEHTEQQGVHFICTPFDLVSARFLSELDVSAYKVASADLTNMELLEYLSQQSKPLILSTGMSLWEEIETTIRFLKARQAVFAMLHCRSVYPVWPREVNLRMINRLKTFGVPVGYSGHEVGIVIPLAAASMGAAIIEKHITLDRKMTGPDHKISLEPYEFKRLVRDIRIADQATGRQKRFLLRGEVLNRELFGKSLVASQDIVPGTTISDEMIATRGPGKGLSPQKKDDLLGITIQRRIQKGDFFLENDLECASGCQEFTSAGQWGLIARFTDFEELLVHRPKVLEFHLAEKDFELAVSFAPSYECQLVVHGPEYIGDKLHDLCSNNEEVRRRSVAQTLRTVELTKKIAPHFQGTPKIVTHPGAMSLHTKLAPTALHANLLRSLEEILPQCGEDIEFLLENLPPYPWYFGGQWKGNFFMAPEEIRDFCSAQNLGLCFDLSHAALHCNAKGTSLADFITIILPHIRHIHFADAYGLDGEGMQLGEGDIDLAEVMPLFANYKGTWVPEIWRGHLNQGNGFLTALQRLHEFGF